MFICLFTCFSLSELKFELSNSVLTIRQNGNLEKGNIDSQFDRNMIENVIFDTDGDTKIGYEAFYYFPNLVSVTLSKNIRSINSTAFRFCKNLSVISIDEDNQYFTVENNVLYNKAETEIYKVPVNTAEFNIPRNVEKIKSHSFHFLKNMSYLKIPSQVTVIESGAFYDSSIITIEFEKNSSIKMLKSESFTYLWLQNLILSDTLEEIGNTSISSYSGSFSLKFQPRSEKQLIINDTSIFNTNIREIEIPENTTIRRNAFNPSPKLETVNIAKNVTLELGCFAGCPNIINFNLYNGTNYTNNEGVIKRDNDIIYVQKNVGNSLNIVGIQNFPNPIFQYAENLTDLKLTFSNNVYFIIENSIVYDDKSKRKVIAAAGGLTSITLPKEVRVLGPYCFTVMAKLTSLIINSELQKIDTYAFYQCHVQEIHFKKVDTIEISAFRECKSKNITFEDGPFTINDYGFYKCLLEEITFKNTSSIGTQAFGYSALKKVKFDNSCKLNSTGSGVFILCKELESVSFHSNIRIISERSFEGCTKLKDVYFSHEMKNLEIYSTAFYQTNIESFEINNTITNIKSQAFSNCKNLRNITISNIPNVEGGIFSECSNLLKIIIKNMDFGENNVKNFERMIQDTKRYVNEITTELKNHPSYLFSNFTALQTVNFNASNINNSLFENCVSLRMVHLKQSPIYVSDRGFYNCKSLDPIILRNIESFGNNSFDGCNFKQSIRIYNNTKYIGKGAFNNTRVRIIHYCSNVNISCDKESFHNSTKAFVSNYNSSKPFCGLETSYIGKSICPILPPTQTIPIFRYNRLRR